MKDILLAFAIIGNVLNLAYNIPFVWVVMKHWNANNISKTFLYLRTLCSIIWIIYAFLLKDIVLGVSYIVILLSSALVTYVKLTQDKPEHKIIIIDTKA